MFPNVEVSAQGETFSRPLREASKDAEEQCVCKSIDKSLKDVCALHELLKANRVVLISKKAAAEFFLQMVPAVPAFALGGGLRAPYCWGPTVVALVASRSS